MIALGLDMGISNMSASLIDLGSGKLLERRRVKTTLKVIKDGCFDQLNAFYDDILPMLDVAECITAERYQPRQTRHHESTTIESINMMLGAMTLNFDVKLITASTWKNAINRLLKKANMEGYLNLDDVYELGKGKIVKHHVDSTLIGLYGATKFDMDLDDILDIVGV